MSKIPAKVQGTPPAVVTNDETRERRQAAQREAGLLGPAALMAMGLAGSALAASGRAPEEARAPQAGDAAPTEPQSLVAADQAAVPALPVDAQTEALERLVAALAAEGGSLVAADGAPAPAAVAVAPIDAQTAAGEAGTAPVLSAAEVDVTLAAPAAAPAEAPAADAEILAQAQAPAPAAGGAASGAATVAVDAVAAAATSTGLLTAVALGALVLGVSSGGGGRSNDTTAPTVTVTDNKEAVVNAAGGAILYTIAFSEAVTGFTADDITVTGGTKGLFIALSATQYSLQVTPQAGFEGNVQVSVAAGAATDAANNASAASTTYQQLVDTKAPTVAITDDRAGVTNGAITYTFTFAESVTGFSADDVAVVNGTKGAFAGSGGVYTLVVTPAAGFEGDVTVNVAASAASDAAGNASAAATQSVQTVDTKAPTVAITDNRVGVANAAVTYTFTFSESVTGFSADDVAVVNGTKGAFAGSGSVYTLVVTPTADFEGDVTVNVAASAASDATGNASTAATQSVQAVDTKAPVVALSGGTAAIVVKSNDGTGNPSTVAITYDSDLDAAKAPLGSAFTIDVNVGGVLSARTVQSVSIDGKVLTLTLAGANIPLGATVTVAYADQAGDGAGTQDLAGNEAAAGTFVKIADGYVRGAKIYIDTNGNGQADPSAVGALAADYYAGETDAEGNFFLPASAPKGTIIAVGGVNIDTGVPNDVPLKAPAGSTTVNPLTTLVQAVLENNVGSGAAAQTAEAIDAATQAVATALGITGAGADLTRYDPVAAAATDPSAQKAAAKIATVFALAEGAGAGSGQTVLENLTTQVQAAIENGATVALDDASTLGAVLAGTNTSLEVQSKIADAAKAIAEAEDLADITKAQSQFLDTVAPASPKGLDLLAASDAGSSDTDNLTNRTTVSVRVALDVSSADGSAAVAGDQVFLLLEGAKVGDARILTAADIANGYVDVDATGLRNGVNNLVARIVDQAGKSSDGVQTPQLQITVDTSAPQPAVINAVGGDDLVNAAEQGSTLAGTAEAGARVALTLGSVTRSATADANGAWSYTLQAADITALGQGDKQLGVVVTDVAGNSSASVTRAFAVDTVAPTITAAITSVVDNVDPTTGALSSGATSNDQTLALSGTVGALGTGERVVVYDGATRLGEATAGSQAGTWTFLTPHLANGAHALSARVEDAAGNAGAASTAFNVTVDTAVPAATAQVAGFRVGAENDGALSGTLTNDATPRVNGTLQGALADGQAVVVYDGATRLGTATVAQGGATWHFDTAGLTDGAHAFSAVVESAAGVQGARSSAVALRIDTVAPSAPTIAVVAGNDVIGSAETGATLSGTAEAGATVRLTLGAGNVRQVQANAGGAWTYQLQLADVQAMGEGLETLQASATDLAGNTSTLPVDRPIRIDTEGPAAPSFTVGGDNAINAADRAQTQTVSGMAEPGSSVTLTVGAGAGATVYRIASDANTGAWSLTLSDADYAALGQGGGKTVSAVATDGAGNSGQSRTVPVIVDTVAPALTPFGLAAGSDSGTKGDGRSNDTTPTFRVTAEAGAKLAFQVGTGAFVDVADGTGAEQTVDLPALSTDGTYTITLRATDSVGNTTLRTGAYTLDTTPPAASSFGTVAGDNVVNSTEAAAGVTVSGQAVPYATIVLRNGANTELGAATIKANAAGAWSYTLSAAELQAMDQGGERLSVVARDAADNDSTPATRDITIDTLAPAAAPVIQQVIDDADGGTFTGALPSTNAVTNDQTLRLTGTANGAVDGDRVAVFDGTVRLGDAEVGQGGAWSFTTPNLSNAAHNLSARVVDAAGNEGPAGAAFAVTVNAERPTATAAVTGFRVGENNASALQGAVTNDTSPAVAGTVTGTLAEGDVVVVYDGATRLGLAQVTGSAWSYSASGLTSGVHDFSAVVESSAGTQGSRGAAVALTVDTAPPVAPTINTVAGDNVINVLEQGVAITGTAEAGARVALTLGSVGQSPNVQTVTAGANGAWSYTLKQADITALGQGTGIVVKATATDAAGNSGAEATRTIEVDTQAPGAPVINAVAGDGIINAAERAEGVIITGTTNAGEGSRLTVTVAGNSYRVAPAEGGQWAYRLSDADFTALGQGGDKTVVVAATDKAGNTGVTATRSFSVDTVAPTLSQVALVVGSDSGSKGDGISNVTTPEFSFSAEAGLSYLGRVGDGQPQVITPVQDGTGLKVTVPAGALAEGPNTLTLRAIDAAGNFTDRSATYVLDTSRPGLAITSDEAPQSVAAIAGGSVVYTFTFNQPVTGFGADDVAVTGGSKGTFSGLSPTMYRLEVTPDAGAEGVLGVSVAAGAAQDVAGNGSLAQQAAAQAFDFRVPTVDITDNRASATNGAITYTITFSEAVTGFTVEDVAVTGGVKEAFTPSTVAGEVGRVYTLVVVPNTGFEGNVTVNVAAGLAADAVGNPSLAAAQNVQLVDTKAPVFQSATSASFAENGTAAAYTASATDASGPVQYTLTGGADKDLFNIDASTGAVRFKTAPNFEARLDAGADNVYNVQITAADTFGQTAARDVAIQVTNVNEAPTGAAIGPKIVALNVAQGGAVSVASAFSDVDAGDALSFSATGLPAGLSLGTDGRLTGTATALTPAGTPATVTVTATDTLGLTATQTFALSVVRAPAVSALTADVPAAKEGTAVVFTMKLSEAVSVTPTEGQTLTLGLSVDGQTLNASYDAPSSNPADATGGVLKFKAVVGGGNDAVVQVAGLSGATIKGLSTQQDLTSPAGSEVAQFVVDNTAPTVTVTDNRNGLTNAAINYTFTFGEAVTGFSAEDVTVTNGAKGAFTPSAVAGEVGRVYTLVVTPTTGFEGNVTVDVAASAASDAAGNASTAAPRSVQAVDTKAPVAPVINSMADNTGNTGDRLTADRTPVLTVSAEPGARIVLGTGGQPLADGSYTAVESSTNPGTYTVSVSANLPDGAYGLVAFDAAGNMSPTPQPGSNSTAGFLIDGTSPGQATIVTLADDTGSSGADRITQDATPTMTVTAEPGATLKVGQNGVETTAAYTAVESTTSPGSYTIAFTGNLADGTYGVRVIDAAGNKDETAADAAKFTIDTQAPTAPTIATVAGDNVINASEQSAVVSGTAPANAVVTLSIGGTARSVSADGSGAWTYTLQSADITAMGQGSETLSATVMDLAGNVSNPGTGSISVDTVAPSLLGGVGISTTAAENQATLYTAAATDASGAVTYTLGGADAALLTISSAGVVTLKTGVLDFDAAGSKKSFGFDVVAKDAANNSATQAVVVNVTNVTSDDVVTRTTVSLDALNPAGTQQTPATYDASQGAFKFTDDITRTNVTEISGFGADDAMEYLGLSDVGNLSIGNEGPDVSLNVNIEGTLSTVILKGAAAALVAADPDAIVYDVDSFNALLVGDLVNIFQV